MLLRKRHRGLWPIWSNGIMLLNRKVNYRLWSWRRCFITDIYVFTHLKTVTGALHDLWLTISLPGIIIL